MAAEFVREHRATFQFERLDVFGGEGRGHRAAEKVLEHAHQPSVAESGALRPRSARLLQGARRMVLPGRD
jgi:hypothetical protein